MYMEKITMHEVYDAQEMQALKGCTIVSVTNADGKEDGEGLCLDCKDTEGNLVSFLILEDGSWHFHDGNKETKEKFITCDGCREKIHVNDQTVELLLGEDYVLIHKNIECLLKFNGVVEGKVTRGEMPAHISYEGDE